MASFFYRRGFAYAASITIPQEGGGSGILSPGTVVDFFITSRRSSGKTATIPCSVLTVLEPDGSNVELKITPDALDSLPAGIYDGLFTISYGGSGEYISAPSPNLNPVVFSILDE